ncbi:ferrous iron transport protein B [Desulfocucumis palustris]|uniref:Ferrous iron transport protein B n=1 Tax=Desulfocucumis palustris TaxID=1898651 RepID=A0A2L2XE12_9FIRM|nr:ferrous iron transport protein B [Desulfocucumis palustris]
MECRDLGKKAGFVEGARYMVLAGNPNVGKSALFNALTGLYADVSNFPGTTVNMCHGRLGKDIIIDTPGIYGISSFTAEEELAAGLILSSHLVINVIDAAHLERDLFLTLHLIDCGVPMLIALNMVDEADLCGLPVDHGLLEDLLGVPVVPTVAVEKKGIIQLVERLPEARPGKIEELLKKRLERLAGLYDISRGEALLLLEGDLPVAEKLGVVPGMERHDLYRHRRERANMIAASVIREETRVDNLASLLGRLTIRPLTGIPILLVVLGAIYLLVGVFFAQTVVQFTEGIIMQGYYEPLVKKLLSGYIDPASPLGVILSGQFGLLTMSVTYLFGLLAPLVLGFFLVISTLEDTGYLPRIAILVDRSVSPLGLNGLAVIPIILGFGCVTMASITTRLLHSDRERLIAIFLLALAVPCSAQLALVTAVLAGLGPYYLILFILIILSVMVAAGTVLSRFLPGHSTPLLVDLPPLRLPRLKNVLTKALIRSWDFIKEAFPIFLGGALFLSLLKVTGLLYLLQTLMEPLTVGWLDLPRESAYAFIMGFIRRDFGTAGLLSLPLQPEQQFVALVTLTLFVPCIASVMVIFKERGWRQAIIIWPVILVIAFIVGGTVARLFDLLGGIPGVNKPVVLIGLLLLLLAGLLVLKGRERPV